MTVERSKGDYEISKSFFVKKTHTANGFLSSGEKENKFTRNQIEKIIMQAISFVSTKLVNSTKFEFPCSITNY